MRRSTCSIVAGLVVALFLLPSSAPAQITTGAVTGRVVDAQGGVIPGATVILISETRGTKSAPVVTNATGDYVFPNVTPDRYTVEVTLEGVQDRAAHGDYRDRRRPRRRGAADARTGGNHRNDHRHCREPARADPERRAVVRRHHRADPEPADRPRELHEPGGLCPGRERLRDSTSAGGTRAGRRQSEQHHDGRHLGHGHGQQRPDAAA